MPLYHVFEESASNTVESTPVQSFETTYTVQQESQQLIRIPLQPQINALPFPYVWREETLDQLILEGLKRDQENLSIAIMSEQTALQKVAESNEKRKEHLSMNKRKQSDDIINGGLSKSKRLRTSDVYIQENPQKKKTKRIAKKKPQDSFQHSFSLN